MHVALGHLTAAGFDCREHARKGTGRLRNCSRVKTAKVTPRPVWGLWGPSDGRAAEPSRRLVVGLYPAPTRSVPPAGPGPQVCVPKFMSGPAAPMSSVLPPVRCPATVQEAVPGLDAPGKGLMQKEKLGYW